MNILTITLVVAALWMLYLAAVSAVAVAVRDAHSSRIVPSVAAGGVFVAAALSLIAVAWMG